MINQRDGVYLTCNLVNAEYKWRCKKHSCSAEQCSLIQATVYKCPGKSTFESITGDVRHCHYDDGYCILVDGSMLIWVVKNNHTWQYTLWFNVTGTLYDHHFVT